MGTGKGWHEDDELNNAVNNRDCPKTQTKKQDWFWKVGFLGWKSVSYLRRKRHRKEEDNEEENGSDIEKGVVSFHSSHGGAVVGVERGKHIIQQESQDKEHNQIAAS